MKALDLFCGGGGAALGLIAAGFDVTGIDRNPKHEKVYPGRFVQNRVEALRPQVLDDFDLIWASPPCQAYSASTPISHRDKYPDLVEWTCNFMADHPMTVIENVPGAPLCYDLMLTGPMFGLNEIERKRYFELSWWSITQPENPKIERTKPPLPVRRNPSYSSNTIRHWTKRGYVFKSLRANKAALKAGMDITTDMTVEQIGEAIPPAYAEYIGRSAMEKLVKEGATCGNAQNS